MSGKYVGMVTEAGRRLAEHGDADCNDFGLSNIGFFLSETDEAEAVAVLRAAAEELEARRTHQKAGAYERQQRRLHQALQQYLYFRD
jgi:hypothetical protein